MMHKRSRYQAGCLTTETRSNGVDVYIFRWREPVTKGISRQRKIVLGSVKELTKTQAQKKANEHLQRSSSPEPVEPVIALTVTELVDHYKERELGEDCEKATKVVKAYKYILKNYVVPKWGSLSLQAVKAVAVEDWLRSLKKANGTKAKIREVFGAAFRHAMRYELYPTNPIAHVRQLRKRTIEPSILEPAEIAAILRELDGVEPVRTAFLIATVMGMRRDLRPQVGRCGLWTCDPACPALLRRRCRWTNKNGLIPTTSSNSRTSPQRARGLEAEIQIRGLRGLGVCLRVSLRKAAALAGYALAEECDSSYQANWDHEAEVGMAHSPQELRFPAAI